MRKKLKWLVFSFSLSLIFGAVFGLARASTLNPEAEKITKAQALVQEGKTEASEKLLLEAIEGEKDRERRARLRMALAVIHYRSGLNDAKAEEQFTKAIDDGTRIADYARYHLGLLKRKAGQSKEARREFERVIEAKPSRATENDARFQVAQVFTSEKQWRPAAAQLEILRKNLRGDERYAEVLLQLATVDRKAGRKAQSCKWAREIYAKYPSATPDWGPRLEANLIAGEKTGCSAPNKDLKTRVRRLWLSGEDDRAAAELKLLKDETDDEGNSMVDNLTINHLVGDGRLDEAMKLLLKRYESEHGRPPYLLLLAKAAAGAGEYQLAVSAYQRAYEIAPRGKGGLNALFQAAFTSYQMQDYDGASRRFEQLIKSNRGDRLAREAQWYISWMRYLRGDYPGALESFTGLRKTAPNRSSKRRRRASVAPTDTVAQDRMQYWSAMSLIRMGRQKEAVPILQTLARDPALGYYAILAYYRLTSLPGASLPPSFETKFGLSQEELKAAAAAIAEEAQAEYAEQSDASEPGESEAVEASEGDEAATEATAETPPVVPVPAAPTLAPGFKDPQLATRFARVRELALVGLENGARRELREIEKRARSNADRRVLMTEFANVKNFERSSYIAEVGFGSARLAGGLKGEGRVYWEHAYPRAWESAVATAAKATSVSEELIWGIMRAESHYRYDAQSPVGAMGLMQIMPFTSKKVVGELLNLPNAKTFDTRTLLEPEVNIRIGSRYLQRLLEKFSSKIPLVAAAYNAGPHRVHAWVRNFGTLEMDEFVEHIPYIETRNYVKRVSRNIQIYSLLYKTNPQTMRWMIQPVGVHLREPYPQQEVW